MNILYVALGGALGAVLRYLISQLPFKGDFPLLTLLTNLLGALIIGFIVGVADNRAVSPNTMLFLKTGFCGGFTTFSTFSLETMNLFDKGKYGTGILYAGLSLALCVTGVWVGKTIASWR